jgi:hypothetical protein
MDHLDSKRGGSEKVGGLEEGQRSSEVKLNRLW